MTEKFKKVTCDFIRTEFTYDHFVNRRYNLEKLEDELTDEMTLDTFGGDSLDFVIYTMELETNYSVNIDDELLVDRGKFGVQVKTFGEICDIVENLENNGGGGNGSSGDLTEYYTKIETDAAIEVVASTGNFPAAVSPESITALAPSYTAFATSEISALVGRGL